MSNIYAKNTRNELISLCKERGISGYTSKKKSELIELLNSSISTMASVVSVASASVSNSTSITTNNENAEISTYSNQKEIIKPFLKWVGGKTQIIEKVISSFPTYIIDYYEPFLGGGSVLLGLLSYIKMGKITVSGKIYASDINSNLITLYKNIQSSPDELIHEVDKIMDDYNNCKDYEVNRNAKDRYEAMTSKESYYYWIRTSFNKMNDEEKKSVFASAILLFMNKTCFRGVYREGPNGFNVPFEKIQKNQSILEKEHIKSVSNLIKDVIFITRPYTESLKFVKKGDFIYMDPPYAPESARSFVSYTKDGFNLEEHNKLFELCKKMNDDHVKWLMSNADVKLVRDTFEVVGDNTYKIETIEARRKINSKNPDSKTNEVLIKNYDSIHLSSVSK
jgi:DNA adenine methylase